MMTVLRACRKEANLTQEQLSRCLKRSPNYIAKIENGERKCSVPEMFEIAEAMRIEPVVLCTRY